MMSAIVPSKIFNKILPKVDRDKLLYNHRTNSVATSKHVIEGFGLERLIECYASGLTDHHIAKFLKVRESQIKTWIAMSAQRVATISRFNDIKRAQKVNGVIDEALDYQVGEVLDKADAAYQSLLLDAMRLKTKTAMDLDARTREKETDGGKSLPIVNIGLFGTNNQVAVSTSESSEPVPVSPFDI